MPDRNAWFDQPSVRQWSNPAPVRSVSQKSRMSKHTDWRHKKAQSTVYRATQLPWLQHRWWKRSNIAKPAHNNFEKVFSWNNKLDIQQGGRSCIHSYAMIQHVKASVSSSYKCFERAVSVFFSPVMNLLSGVNFKVLALLWECDKLSHPFHIMWQFAACDIMPHWFFSFFGW